MTSLNTGKRTASETASLLIVGCGDIGQRVGLSLAEEGWHVDAVRRHPARNVPEFTWHAADYSEAGSLSFAETLQPEYVLTTFTPTSMDLEGYRRGFVRAARNVIEGLGHARAKHLIMVSSTRVYAEQCGGWVDESSPLSETDERAAAIIEAERLFLTSDHRTSVVRFGGIYGGPDSRLLCRIASGRISPASPIRYTNRIHREDCAGFLAHLLRKAQSNETLSPVYNGVDNAPVAAHEVESWIASLMKVESSVDSGTSSAGPVSHKRCSNHSMHASGYVLKYPDYRAGYKYEIANR